MAEQSASGDLFAGQESTSGTVTNAERRVASLVSHHGISKEEAWVIVRESVSKNLGPMTPDSQGSKSAKVAQGNNASDTASRVTISDELLPALLKPVGILGAMSQGLVQVEGEHPLSAALRENKDDPTAISEKVREFNNQLVAAGRNRQIPLAFPHHGPRWRITSTDLARVSLFHVGSNNLPRRACQNELMGGVGDTQEVRYTGIELRQADEAIFRQLIHEAAMRYPGEWIDVSRCEFVRSAKGVRRHLSGKELKELKQTLLNFRAGVIYVRNRTRKSFVTLNLLTGMEGDEFSLKVQFDPRLIILFDAYTMLDYQMTAELSGIALKLYTYLCSLPPIAETLPTGVKTLFELCYGTMESQIKTVGRPTEEERELAIRKKLSDFAKKGLPGALDLLIKEGVLTSYEINGTPRDRKVVMRRNVPAQLQ